MNRDTGEYGEEIACRYLMRRGFFIVARNFRCRQGEIDIVARGREDNDALMLFVEVKTTLGSERKVVELRERISVRKLERCMRAIQVYLATRARDTDIIHVQARLDACFVSIDRQYKKASVLYVPNAFS